MRALGVGLFICCFAFACGDNKGAGDAGMDGPAFKCGNGVLDPNEQCDDGDQNGGVGHPCDTTCHWMCLSVAYCDDRPRLIGLGT